LGLTGIASLDHLINPVKRNWLVEVYGEEESVRITYHHIIAESSKHGLVAVAHIQEFGGLNPYLLARLARMKGGLIENIVVSRAFRLRDVANLIMNAVKQGAETIVVVNPYLYSPRKWTSYSLLTPVTAALRRASREAQVIVANESTKFGRRELPEGGNFHHHTVHVIVRLGRIRGGILARLIKHPAKRTPAYAMVSWVEVQPLINNINNLYNYIT